MVGHKNPVVDYAQTAFQARKKILEMIFKAQTSHIGSNLSAVDIAMVLYEKADLEKDKIIWSAGWKAATAYYFLARKGVIPPQDLDTYCQDGSRYIGLLEPTVKGVDCAGGSMGIAFSMAIGIARAKKARKKEGMVYVIMSDGEMHCGNVWESAMKAANEELDNITVLIDANGFTAMGEIKEVQNIEPLIEKWEAFNWRVLEADGHNYEELEKVLEEESSFPKVIICRTVKGKGISFMSNNNEWHYRVIDDESYALAQKELR